MSGRFSFLERVLKREFAFDCGHVFRKGEVFRVYGCKLTPKLRALDRSFCPGCLVKMSCRCWYCGRPILPGEMITHYRVDNPVARSRAKVPRKDMTFHEGYPVGCTSCAEMKIADACGYWAIPGIADFSRNPIDDLAGL